MVYNKKAISPVVATALLLVVAVVAVVGFQTWFNTYQSGQLSEIEERATTGAVITLERLESERVFLHNRGRETLNVSVRVNGIDQLDTNCDSDPSLQLPPGVHDLSFPPAEDCPTEGRAEVIVVSEPAGVFDFTAIVRGTD